MDRKLATIFASDVVGFSKMMGTDEVKTLKILKERRNAIDNIIDEHGGIIFGSAGDSVIAEFSSPIKAAEAAVAARQQARAEENMSDGDPTTLPVPDSDEEAADAPFGRGSRRAAWRPGTRWSASCDKSNRSLRLLVGLMPRPSLGVLA
mgnify:CR=1 FL=1